MIIAIFVYIKTIASKENIKQLSTQLGLIVGILNTIHTIAQSLELIHTTDFHWLDFSLKFMTGIVAIYLVIQGVPNLLDK